MKIGGNFSSGNNEECRPLFSQYCLPKSSILRVSKVLKIKIQVNELVQFLAEHHFLVFLRGKSEEEKLEEHRKSGQLQVDLRGG